MSKQAGESVTPETEVAGFTEDHLTSALGELFGESEDQADPAESQEDDATDDEPALEEETDESEETDPSQDEEEDEEAEAASDETTAEDEESGESEEDAEAGHELPHGAQKRIDKLTARAKTAEEKLQALEQELTQLRNSQAVEPVDPDNRFADVEDVAALRKKGVEAQEILDWCEDNADGGVITNSKGEETEYTAEQVKEIRKAARRAINIELPAQSQYIAARQQFDPIAEQAYPWLKDKSSQEFQFYQTVLRVLPQIKRIPEFKLVVGDWIKGKAAREAEVSAAAKKKAPVKAVTKPKAALPTKVAAPKQKPKQQSKSASASNRFLQSGRVDHLAEAIEDLI